MANHDSNQGKRGLKSSQFEENKGRIKRLPLNEIRKLAKKGGEAKSEKKRLSCQINPIKTGQATYAISISKCNECPVRNVCNEYEKNSACKIEISIRRNLIGHFKAFVGTNPEDMLKEMMKIYMKIEQATKEDPTFYNLSQQLYLLMNIYKMKYGDKSSLAMVNLNVNNPSLDVKDIMKKIRATKQESG